MSTKKDCKKSYSLFNNVTVPVAQIYMYNIPNESLLSGKYYTYISNRLLPEFTII